MKALVGGACRRSQIVRKQSVLPLPHRVLRGFHVTSSQHSEDDKTRSTAESEFSSQSSTPSYEPALPTIDLTTKTVETPVGDLPLSPLMDPTFYERRQRFTKRKAPQAHRHQRTDLQEWLRDNPYALALATPPRICAATEVVLPKYFLQGFRPARHPVTKDNWEVPLGLNSHGDTTQPPGRTGKAGYLLSRRDFFHEFNITDSQFYRKNEVLGSRAENHHNVKWRDDMSAVVLEMMRRRVVEEITYLANLCDQGRSHLKACPDWDDAKDTSRHQHLGCLLYFREPSGPVLPQLSTVDVGGIRRRKRLPVHDMEMLLGPEHTTKLKEDLKLFQSGFIYAVCGKRSIRLQLRLWKLQGFMSREEYYAPQHHQSFPYRIYSNHPMAVRKHTSHQPENLFSQQ